MNNDFSKSQQAGNQHGEEYQQPPSGAESACAKPQALKGKRPAHNSCSAHARFSSIRNFSASSSCLVMPCRAIAVARYKAGTCLILLPRSTLRRSFCTSGSAPTFKNTSYASGMDRVFSIRPCLTRMRWYEGTANADGWACGACLFCFRCFICNYADTFSQSGHFLMRSKNCRNGVQSLKDMED